MSPQSKSSRSRSSTRSASTKSSSSSSESTMSSSRSSNSSRSRDDNDLLKNVSDSLHPYIERIPKINNSALPHELSAEKHTSDLLHDLIGDGPELSGLSEASLDHIRSLAKNDRMEKLNNLVKVTQGEVYDSTCIRNRSNWANPKKEHQFEKEGKGLSLDQIKENVMESMEYESPKLVALLDKIDELDKEDMKKYGRRFKHFIFSDLKNYHGTKMITSALLAKGFQLGYNIRKRGTGEKEKRSVELKPDSELLKTEFNNFFLLSSVGLFDEPIRVEMKKAVLKKFNERPNNVYGKYARIIVMDSGFKEGIDLFDIKYVHMFEPQTTLADQKQVIGRGTRTCGQKGLKFDPKLGWPLYVFKYDLQFNENLKHNFANTETAFNYYLLSQNIDIRLVNLTSNLEALAIRGSVDYNLNRAIHTFSGSEEQKGGQNDQHNKNDLQQDGGEQLFDTLLPNTKLSAHRAMRRYIDKNFSQYKWDDVKMENLCGYEGPDSVKSIHMGGKNDGVGEYDNQGDFRSKTDLYGNEADSSDEDNNSSDDSDEDSVLDEDDYFEEDIDLKTGKITGGAQVIKYSPTQAFISNYFTPELPIKGMLLWQSVGTGKTCTAIATATKQFEAKGYTILWVTRTTLKNDIWKNMFEQVCHEKIREEIENGAIVPEDRAKRMKMLSKSWSIRPMSYKQFSNLVSKANSLYKDLVKKNGATDPLRKTLLVIDEAHKLYGGGDLSSIERPDMDALHKALMNSYLVSGSESVKLMLMTATPITENPLEFVKLLNLCHGPDKQIPDDIDSFSKIYLDDLGNFTETGKLQFLDDIAGHVSYLNRENDGRQFSRPILKNVLVPIASPKLAKEIQAYDKDSVRLLFDSKLAKYKKDIEVQNDKINKELKYLKPSQFSSLKEVCDKYEKPHNTYCKKIVKEHIKQITNESKQEMADVKAHVKQMRESIKGEKLFAKKSLANIRETLKMMKSEKSKVYDNYKKSAYYTMKSKCSRKWKTQKELEEMAKSHPSIIILDNYTGMVDNEVNKIQTEFALEDHAVENKIKEIIKFSKTKDLSDLERSTLLKIVKDYKKALSSLKERHNNSMKVVNAAARQTKKKLLNHRKTLKNNILKQVKRNMVDIKSQTRQIESAEKKMVAQLKKNKDYADDIPEQAKKILNNHREQILNQLDDNIKQAVDAKEAEKAEKVAAKQAAKEAAKAEKVAAKQTAKEAAKAEKAAAKEAVKAEKAAAKEAEKTRKLREKEAAKAAKAASKTRKNK